MDLDMEEAEGGDDLTETRVELCTHDLNMA